MEISAVVSTDLFAKLKASDHEFLEKTIEKFDERRQNLIKQLLESNSQMLAQYRSKFWDKVDRAFKLRERVLELRKASVQEEIRSLVDDYQVCLRKESAARLEELGLRSGRTANDMAEIADRLEDITRHKLRIYEDDIKSAHDIGMKKARDSAFNTIEICKLMNSEIQAFIECDTIHVREFSRRMGDIDSIYQELISSSDSKFRAYLASQILLLGDKFTEEEQRDTVSLHRDNRDKLVDRRSDSKDDDMVAEHIALNSSVLASLGDECDGCFGRGKISTEFFEFCKDTCPPLLTPSPH